MHRNLQFLQSTVKNAAVGEYEIVGGNADASKDYVDMNIAVKETFFTTNKVTIVVKKDGKRRIIPLFPELLQQCGG